MKTIQVYAPTSADNDEEIEKVYDVEAVMELHKALLNSNLNALSLWCMSRSRKRNQKNSDGMECFW